MRGPRDRADDLRAPGWQLRDEMLAVARRLGDDNGIAIALYCQADIPWEGGDFAAPYAARLGRHRTGQVELGARLLGGAEAALDRAGAKIGVGQGGPAGRQRARALAAATVGAQRLAELHAEGYGLADDEAVALALSVALSHPAPARSLSGRHRREPGWC